MPRPRPLPSPDAARSTLAHRLTGRADRLRQLYTKFGLRSTRVFLVWTIWSGERRGEGNEHELVRIEILPTPRVSDETAIRRRIYSQGILPDGSLRVDQISAGAYTTDNLEGKVIPRGLPACCGCSVLPPWGEPVAGTLENPEQNPRVDFFYELVDDGRGSDPSSCDRYRPLSDPERREGSLYFAVNLERTSEDRDRLGKSGVGKDDVL